MRYNLLNLLPIRAACVIIVRWREQHHSNEFGFVLSECSPLWNHLASWRNPTSHLTPNDLFLTTNVRRWSNGKHIYARLGHGATSSLLGIYHNYHVGFDLFDYVSRRTPHPQVHGITKLLRRWMQSIINKSTSSHYVLHFCKKLLLVAHAK